MKPEPRSISLLRGANPASVEPAAARSLQALAVFQQIIEQPRIASDRRRGRRAIAGAFGLRARLAVGGAGIGAVIAAVLIALLSGSALAPASAFAGWTARPASALKQGVLDAARHCGLKDPVLTEARGPYTAAVFASRFGGTACVVGPGMSFAASVGGARAPDNRFGPGQVGVAVNTGANSQGVGLIVLTGRVGSAVRAVVIHRRGGPDVVASISHGWFLAWWPEGSSATYATVTTTAGEHRLALPSLARSKLTCAPPPANFAHHHHKLRSSCAAASAGTDGPGSDGLPVPPMVGSVIGSPYHGSLLFNVWNATSVRVCFHPPSNLNVAIQPHGPTGPCSNATLLSRLPPHYPVQKNLLELFPKGVWEVRLPTAGSGQTDVSFLVVPHGARGYGQRSELTVTR